MTQGQTNVNGCVYCGHLERGHGQRYDGLHPRGKPLYRAPTNTARKIRMLRNRYYRLGDKRWEQIW